MQSNLFGEPAPGSSTAAQVCTSAAEVPPSRVDAKADYEQWRQAISWLSERYENLHLWFLNRNLRLLADPLTGDAERSEILDWIAAPPDDSRPIEPFSFRACLALYDERCDVLETRCRIRALNRQVLQRRRELRL